MKGQIGRRAMELGVLPVVPASFEPPGFFEEAAPVSQESWDSLEEFKTPDPSRVRLMATVRRIDPLVADLIESLSPVYLVKG